MTMTIHEKLERITRYSNRSALSRAAGLGPTTLSMILARRSEITVSTAVKLAKTLGVDLNWLVNPEAGWPPVRVEEPEDGDHVPTPIAA